MTPYPDNLTASAMFEIVKDVPREAWPCREVHRDCTGTWPADDNDDPPCMRWVIAGWDVDTDTAAHAFNGAMAAWLLEQNGYVYLTLAHPGVEVEVCLSRTAPTLLEALAQACKDVK